MIKRIVSFLFVIVIALSFISCTKQPVDSNTKNEVQEPSNGQFNPGTYEGKATGYGGEVTVTVVLSEDRIESITCNGDKETVGIGKVAVDKLPKEIVSKQSVEVDAISGATFTSTAIKEAVTQALEQALTQTDANVLDLIPVSAKPIGVETQVEEKLSADLVVIGAGGAGLTAALEAKTQGLEVIVLEKQRVAGGNTISATEGSEDSFLSGEVNGGIDFIEKLLKELEECKVDILFQTQATKLILENGKITGVAATGQSKNYKIQCNAVVLATGGFGANNEMITTYAKEYENYKTMNSEGSTGDGVRMAQEVGAKLVHMEQIQVYPTVEVNTNTTIAQTLREYGAILVNQNGERFFNECSRKDLVSKAIMAQEGNYAYLIFDQQLREKLNVINEYINSNSRHESQSAEASYMVVQEEKLSDLTKDLGVDCETLNRTIKEWNTNLSSGLGDDYNRTLEGYQPISVAPYYAIKVTPAILSTLGGVEITSKAEVISSTGGIIPGLYAAGEVISGIQAIVKTDSNSMEDITTYGRIAAQNAAIYIKGDTRKEINKSIMKNTDVNLTGSKHDIEKQTQKKEYEKFNNITQKKKVENQNQEHNVVREGKGPQNSFK